VLLLDEPASGLDPRARVELRELLRAIREQGKTLVLVEHDMSLVMSVCDTIHVVDHGETIAEGPPSVIRSHPKVLAAYLGQEAEPGAP